MIKELSNSFDPDQKLIPEAVKTFRYYFDNLAYNKLGRSPKNLEIKQTKTRSKRGAEGSLYITRVFFEADGTEMSAIVAMKFPNEAKSIKNELINSLLIERRLSHFFTFSTPKVLFASTMTPPIIVYEGIEGKNYDELPNSHEKAFLTGRLLATIQGINMGYVDISLYKDLIRILGLKGDQIKHGFEKEFLEGCKFFVNMLEKNSEESLIFGDFHQSNVMISGLEEFDKLRTIYVIDPHYVQVKGFSRAEDIGIFFSNQAFEEWRVTGNFSAVLKDFHSFLQGYDYQLSYLNGPSLSQIFSNGLTVDYFIAQWGVLDAMDYPNRVAKSIPQATILKEMTERVDFSVEILKRRPFYNAFKAYLETH